MESVTCQNGYRPFPQLFAQYCMVWHYQSWSDDNTYFANQVWYYLAMWVSKVCISTGDILLDPEFIHTWSDTSGPLRHWQRNCRFGDRLSLRCCLPWRHHRVTWITCSPLWRSLILRILKTLLPQNNTFFMATASVVKDAADDPDCQGSREQWYYLRFYMRRTMPSTGQFRGSFFQDTAGDVVRSSGLVCFDVTKELLDAIDVHLDVANRRKVGSILCRYIRGLLLSKDGFELVVQDFCFRSAIRKQFPRDFSGATPMYSPRFDEFPKGFGVRFLDSWFNYVVHIVWSGFPHLLCHLFLAGLVPWPCFFAFLLFCLVKKSLFLPR